ncbi:MAG: hypothetical protein IRY92_13055, partial [Dactylosporangium sp.]|nr:hypothetical protein [Dactylosporangium sp.]
DPASRGVSAITLENRQAGSRAWAIGADRTRPNDDIQRQITGYASATSVALGEKIDFHVSVNPAGPFTIAIYRMGWYGGVGARHLLTSPTLEGSPQPDPITDPRTLAIRCDWPVSWTLEVPSDWTSGFYYAVFTSERGYRSMTPFIVRDPSARDNLCVVVGTTTYQAYNQWPLDGVTGRSLYYGYAPDGKLDPERRSHEVTFDRPYARTGQPSRVEFDLTFIRWAESQNFNLTYADSIDLHAGRIEPGRYAGLIFISHDEYWSIQMRQHATEALERGTSLAFLEANNVYWHVRIVDGANGRPHRGVVCYKGHEDPDPAPPGATVRWRSDVPGPRMPEQMLLGIQYNGVVKRPAPLIV